MQTHKAMVCNLFGYIFFSITGCTRQVQELSWFLPWFEVFFLWICSISGVIYHNVNDDVCVFIWFFIFMSYLTLPVLLRDDIFIITSFWKIKYLIQLLESFWKMYLLFSILKGDAHVIFPNIFLKYNMFIMFSNIFLKDDMFIIFSHIFLKDDIFNTHVNTYDWSL